MNFTVKCLFEPEILGITWIPGELILVGARPECGKSRYVLGNCIVAGTKGLIPVAYFVPNGSTYKISKTMMEMIVGGSASNNEKDLPNNMPEYPLYIDCSPHLTIEYLVERIFHMVKEHGVKMVAIDTLQDVDGGVFSASTREKEMTFILRILKNLAEALDLVVIVTSQLSENVQWSNQTPQIKDILYVPFAEDLCDQIVLIKSMAVLEDAYQLVLPKGFTIFDGEYGEMIINTVLDKEKGYLKKADKLFSDEVHTYHDDPMYKWFLSEADNVWRFGFLDSEGMGWEISITPSAESEKNEYDIDADNWAGDHINIAMEEPGDDMEKLKAFALREARRRFPAVGIPEKG